jgi:hypothetical protein
VRQVGALRLPECAGVFRRHSSAWLAVICIYRHCARCRFRQTGLRDRVAAEPRSGRAGSRWLARASGGFARARPVSGSAPRAALRSVDESCVGMPRKARSHSQDRGGALPSAGNHAELVATRSPRAPATPVARASALPTGALSTPPGGASAPTGTPSTPPGGVPASRPRKVTQSRAFLASHEAESLPIRSREAFSVPAGSGPVLIRIGGRAALRARAFLQLDHIEPWAALGAPVAENIRILCRGHNQLHARNCFGAKHIAAKSRLGKPTPTTKGWISDQS